MLYTSVPTTILKKSLQIYTLHTSTVYWKPIKVFLFVNIHDCDLIYYALSYDVVYLCKYVNHIHDFTKEFEYLSEYCCEFLKLNFQMYYEDATAAPKWADCHH